MNISYRWLSELLPELEDSAEVVAARLAAYGAPVDRIEPIGRALSDIRLARVTAVREHPNADRLVLCDVDAGGIEEVQVVCGAPNVEAGRFYPFAPVGALLPGGMKIRKAKIRGEVSEGMLCSARELELGPEHSGILAIPGEFEPGAPFAETTGLDDFRLDVEVTPNRPDLLSHVGIARELRRGGGDQVVLRAPDGLENALSEDVELVRCALHGEAGEVPIHIEDSAGCYRYVGVVLRGVEVGDSPAWLASRLRALGLRPINNVVDATNFVLHELGQPLHAFDLGRLGGPAVRIRRARDGESLVTLDGETRRLDGNHLVIADAERPIALAGVMGGRDTEVTSATRNVFLEVALFDPAIVRAGRGSLGLSTDASYRFERGVDPEGLPGAARRAVALIRGLTGAQVEGTAADLYPEPREAPVVSIRPTRAARLLGRSFDADGIADLLAPLGLQEVSRDEERVHFRIPGHRWYDLEREVDLIEEVARRYGYDEFPEQSRSFRPSTVPDDALLPVEAAVRSFFIARGFHESRTAAFAAEEEGDVVLQNPLSAEEGRLRRDLLRGLGHRVSYNFARGARHVRLFEIGTVFAPSESGDERPHEATHLAAVFTGATRPPHWTAEAQSYDVWDLKGIAGDLATLLGKASVEPVQEESGGGGEAGTGNEDRNGAENTGGGIFEAAGPVFALLNGGGERIGRAGRVAATAVDAPAWADPVWGLELTLRAVEDEVPNTVFQELPSQPATERDLSLLVPGDLPAAEVEASIRNTAGELLEAVEVFDLYEGSGIPAGTRSISFRLRYRAPDRTLTDSEADEETTRILRKLTEEHGVRQRG